MARPEYVPDQVRGHADEADGIEEYDNNLPTWWIGLFYFSILWAVVVFVDWHVLSPISLAANYEAEMAAAPQPVDLSTIAIVITWGGSRTSSFSAVLQSWTRTAVREGTTRYTATLVPTGAVSEA